MVYWPKGGMYHGKKRNIPVAEPCLLYTSHRAEIAAKLSNDVELIEKTAKEVDDSIATYLLKNVTQELSLIHIWPLSRILN